MVKITSVLQFGRGAAPQAIRDAQQEPVLVTKENRPVAWILSAEKLAKVAAARGDEFADTYERALDLVAVELYRQAILTLEQGALLAGVSLHDFIDLCSALRVPILWEPEGGIAAEVERLESLLRTNVLE